MPDGFLKLISNSIQRWPVIPEDQKNSLFHRVVRNAARRIYCSVFLFSPNRRKVNATFWGGEGGYIHAARKFNLEDEDWQHIYTQFAEEVLRHVSRGTKILELGCSAGQWCRRLEFSEKGCFYTGVDINPMTIDFAREKFSGQKNASFFAEDLIDFDRYDGIDLVMVCQTFFFLDRATLENVLRKIKPGTLLVFQEPVNEDFRDQKSSVPMKYRPGKVGTGFSHNYPVLLMGAGYEIRKETLIERDTKEQKKLLVTAYKRTS